MTTAINIIVALTMLVLVPIGFGKPDELQDWVLVNIGISVFVFIYVYIAGGWGWFKYFEKNESDTATNLVLIEGLKLAILGVILNEKVALYNQATIFLFVITTILASIIYYSAMIGFINFVNQEEK